MNTDRGDIELGGLFMVGLPGTDLDSSTRQLIEEGRVNHFILFKRNVANRSQLRRLCLALRRTCEQQGLLEPLIAIDQEGGSVARLGPPFTRFAGARALAESPAPDTALTDYARTCATELLDVGINMNLAPVLDICPAGQGFFMEQRVLGENPEKAAELGALVISEMQRHGLAASAKHFPGLGQAVIDPHQLLPTVNRSAQELRACDLVPFLRAIEVDVASVMTSHTVYRHLDPATPATMSHPILTDLLRRELGYDGVIVTDDLEMGAIEKQIAVDTAAWEAFRAGADLLLICRDHAKVRRAIVRGTAALAAGALDASCLRASLARLADLSVAYTPGITGR